jgi:hypothetical protein
LSERHVEDRRKFLKTAASAAWATPLVLTLGASRAGAQALSCLPSLTICGVPDGGGCETTGFVACCGGFSCVQVTQLNICRCE